MTGQEYAELLERMSDGELMQAAAEWMSDSISAHYEFGGDAPSEIQGKRIMGELYRRAAK